VEGFDLAVTPTEAQEALEDFVSHRLDLFGRFQDAMWSGRPFLYHSRLASLLNLKLLGARKAVAAVEESDAPINSVEGFIRQVLGWREYVRGIYWYVEDGYRRRSDLGARRPLPGFFWDGQTTMRCVSQVMRQLLEHGYAHHIQRLMVMGLFALLHGARPAELHEWHLAMYLDGFDWASLPNVIGMSQFADGGLLATKPYAASGNYIDRMSDYCGGCEFDPSRATGEGACPFTVLYWDFLAEHRDLFLANRRMAFQIRNLDRKDQGQIKDIRSHAARLREALSGG
jgi:deoxyribodipyrimidine photolyase-related protein